MNKNAIIAPKAGILDISPYVAGKSAVKAEVERILKLSSNENSLGPSPKAIKAYNAHGSALYRYPDSSALALRVAIGRVHGLDPARIIAGSGSDELIGLLMHAYAGAGDEVLYSQHGFLMYKIYAQACGAIPIAAPEKHLTADVSALLAHVSERTRMVFLANPNNPTGSYLPAGEVKRLRDRLPEDVLLVIDGAYAEYADRPDYSDGRELVDRGENTAMLRTFSKIYGLASLRLGWGYFPGSIADVINRVRGPFNVSGAALATGVAAIEDVEYAAHCQKHNRQWREWLAAEIAAMGLIAHPSLANFLLAEFPKTGKTAAAANRFLLSRGIIPREVGAYGLPHALRITIGTEVETRAVAETLRVFMQSDID